MNFLGIRSCNIKRIRPLKKKKLFWNKVKKEKGVEMWAIQECNLDARQCSPRKQWFGSRLVFYGDGENGFQWSAFNCEVGDGALSGL